MPARTGTFSAELKPRQGKLLRCRLTLEQGIVADIRFTGDFFLIPGDAITQLEEVLKGTSVDDIRPCITEFFAEVEVELLGVTPVHFVEVATMTLK